MGAAANAATGKESTHVFARILDEHTDPAFELLADMFARPALPEDEIDSERQVILEEIAMYEDEPQDRVHDVLAEAIYGDPPLGRRVLGSSDVIASVEVPAIRSYHDARYSAVQRGGRGGGTSTTTRSVELAERSLALSGESNGVAPDRRGRRRAKLPLLREGHRAVPRVLRRSGHRARRRPALYAHPPRQLVRWVGFLSPLPRDPREARPGLLGRLLHGASSWTTARSRCTSAPARTTSRRPARSSAASSRRCTRRAWRPRSSLAPRST